MTEIRASIGLAELPMTGLSNASKAKGPITTIKSSKNTPENETSRPHRQQTYLRRPWAWLIKFGKFVGPGTLIAVAFVDPDNYQTDIVGGAKYGYNLLFMLLFSNLVAIFLQALSLKLGSVTGLDLAQLNRRHLPKWLNIILWLLAEASVMASDIGQVVGTAIALNLLVPQIPIPAGCALALFDCLFILVFYRPDRSLRGLRYFEVFVAAIVLAVVICFCIQLSQIDPVSVGPIFKGYLPSRFIFQGEALYFSCALLGGTLQPHTLYLGSALVQARLRNFDKENGSYEEIDEGTLVTYYKPSLQAIKSCFTFSVWELCLSLFVIALFVNSAILIVAATSFGDDFNNADLFSLYNLFVENLSIGAAKTFACGLLFSGVSAGIICTMAGQLIMEGAMNWRISPFLRRLITRSIAVIPGMIIGAVIGRPGLADALEGANVALSIALIFITAPIVYYTSSNKYMEVRSRHTTTPHAVHHNLAHKSDAEGQDIVSFANGWAVTIIAWFLWLVMTFMNVALLVFLGLGIDSD